MTELSYDAYAQAGTGYGWARVRAYIQAIRTYVNGNWDVRKSCTVNFETMLACLALLAVSTWSCGKCMNDYAVQIDSAYIFCRGCFGRM